MGVKIDGVFQRKDQSTGQWVNITFKDLTDKPETLARVACKVNPHVTDSGVVVSESTITDTSSPAFECIKDIDPFGYLFERDDTLFKALGLDYWGETLSLEITKSKGLPDDFNPCAKGSYGAIIGSFKHSWLTSTEMLNWWYTAPETSREGILSRQGYLLWDKVSVPNKDYFHRGQLTRRPETDRVDLDVSTNNFEAIHCAWIGRDKASLAGFFEEIN